MKKRIAIISVFQDYKPGYSLTGIVRDQITMLQKYGHEVTLFVSENCNEDSFEGFTNIKKVMPFAHLKDYTSRTQITPDHLKTVAKNIEVYERELKDIDIAFTHDLVFTGWNLPYAKAIMEGSTRVPHVRWLHWIHSIPSLNRDWWNIRMYTKAHKIVYPNNTERTRVAEQFQGIREDVRVIHHIKDLRTWMEFHPDTMALIDEYPALMQADVVQILPASVDRLESKRVREVMLIFSNFKRMGLSVCLCIVNQWATGTQQKQDVEHYNKIARRNGLTPDECFFTSGVKAEWEVGVSRRMIRELFACSNLFIFPTREESFGLVVPEAAHAGVLMMLNKSLDMMHEVGGMASLYADFGSHHRGLQIPNNDEKNYFKGLANIIIGRMKENEAITSKTHARQKYNYDYLYNRQYAPVMSESEMWPAPSNPAVLKEKASLPPGMQHKGQRPPTIVVQDKHGNQKVVELTRGSKP